jgi:hypothetical protein
MLGGSGFETTIERCPPIWVIEKFMLMD